MQNQTLSAGSAQAGSGSGAGNNAQAAERKAIAIAMELANAREELAKQASLRTRLEDLCRQLQQENRQIKEDAVRRDQLWQSQTEQERGMSQKALTSMKAMILTYQEQVELQNNARTAMDARFTQMTQKLDAMSEQYELREQHFEKQLNSKELELKLAAAKFEQQRHIANMEKTKNEKLVQALRALRDSEIEKSAHLGSYAASFRLVEDVATKSNEMFHTCRAKISETEKTNRKLATDNAKLLAKHDNAQQTLSSVIFAYNTTVKLLDGTTLKLYRIQGLCRALQAERTQLRSVMERVKGTLLGLQNCSDPTIANAMTQALNETGCDFGSSLAEIADAALQSQAQLLPETPPVQLATTMANPEQHAAALATAAAGAAAADAVSQLEMAQPYVNYKELNSQLKEVGVDVDTEMNAAEAIAKSIMHGEAVVLSDPAGSALPTAGSKPFKIASNPAVKAVLAEEPDVETEDPELAKLYVSLPPEVVALHAELSKKRLEPEQANSLLQLVDDALAGTESIPAASRPVTGADVEALLAADLAGLAVVGGLPDAIPSTRGNNTASSSSSSKGHHNNQNGNKGKKSRGRK